MKVVALLALACLAPIVCLAAPAPEATALPGGTYNRKVVTLREQVRELTKGTVAFREYFEGQLEQAKEQVVAAEPDSEPANEYGRYIVGEIKDLAERVGKLQVEASNIQDNLEQNKVSNGQSSNQFLVILSGSDQLDSFAQFTQQVGGLKQDVTTLLEESQRLRDVYESFERFQGKKESPLVIFGTEISDTYYIFTINDIRRQVDFLRIAGVRLSKFLQDPEGRL